VSRMTPNLITTPTSTTWPHGVRCMRDSGGRPPKIRVASAAPLSSAVMTGGGVSIGISWPNGTSEPQDRPRLRSERHPRPSTCRSRRCSWASSHRPGRSPVLGVIVRLL
jgi:hypothetical protein